MSVEQPFGLIRFYDSKLKRVHERGGREVSSAIYPVLWNVLTRLLKFELFSDEEYDTIIDFKVVCDKIGQEIDHSADIAHISNIPCDARNITFNAWLYYSDQSLTEALEKGMWHIEITFQDVDLNEETWYSNEFVII